MQKVGLPHSRKISLIVHPALGRHTTVREGKGILTQLRNLIRKRLLLHFRGKNRGHTLKTYVCLDREGFSFKQDFLSGPDNSLLWGTILCIAGCLAAFLVSTAQMPGQPKMSPNIVNASPDPLLRNTALVEAILWEQSTHIDRSQPALSDWS